MSLVHGEEPVPAKSRPNEWATVRTDLRPSAPANPAALGLAGFAVANLMLNFINSGWLPQSALPGVLPLAFFAGGLAQLIAAIGEFRRGDTFGTTAFGSYGVFWLSLWGFFTFEENKFPTQAVAHHALAVFLGCWLIWTVFVWIASFRVSVVLNLLFLDLIGVFAFLSAGFAFGNQSLVHIGGYLGIVLSVIGFYGAVAALVNETFGRRVVPNRELIPRSVR
jgi:succinate-acetate transporter protein